MTTEAVLNSSDVVAPGAAPEKWMYLLHGIYGSGRNWGSLARQLVERRQDWGVVLVDLRLHGGSPDLPGPHTVEACARDVRGLEQSRSRPAEALLGHSFGGKVALVRAGMSPEVPEVWVADSTLRTGEPTGTAWGVIDIVRRLPERFQSREELADALVAEGYERGVGMWLGMNLERDGDGFVWKLDWEGVEEMLRDYFRTDVWESVENPPGGAEVRLISATRSEAIDSEAAKRIEAAGARTGQTRLFRVEAGHWLNVDNPDAVLDLLAEHLH